MSVKWKADNKTKLAKENGYNLTSWRTRSDRTNITGKLPSLPERLGGSATNMQLAEEFSKKSNGKVTTRQCSKWRNHRIKEIKTTK